MGFWICSEHGIIEAAFCCNQSTYLNDVSLPNTTSSRKAVWGDFVPLGFFATWAMEPNPTLEQTQDLLNHVKNLMAKATPRLGQKCHLCGRVWQVDLMNMRRMHHLCQTPIPEDQIRKFNGTL